MVQDLLRLLVLDKGNRLIMAGQILRSTIKYYSIMLLVALTLCLLGITAARADISQQPNVQRFINNMVTNDGFKKKDLDQLFAQVNFNPKVIEIMTQPLESKPWYVYQKILVGEPRISQGVQFWNEHAATLARAEKEFGVPANIIVSIIGIESNYGRAAGNYSVIDSLSTLAFTYPIPKRSAYFKQELAQFLILSREQKLDPLKMTGSYAGAIGMPQFMPSSYRKYGIDYSGLHQVNLNSNADDVIGSIANYLSNYGWKRNGAVAMPTSVRNDHYQRLKTDKLAPLYTATQLGKTGVVIGKNYPHGQRANLIVLQGETQPVYWLGFNNFYVITGYNPSNLYALAVYQLAQAIAVAHNTPPSKH